MSELPEEERKRVIKEAIKEWLDEMFLAFGKWSFGALAAAAFAAFIYFILNMTGWHK